jgi:hypothetical protein
MLRTAPAYVPHGTRHKRNRGHPRGRRDGVSQHPRRPPPSADDLEDRTWQLAPALQRPANAKRHQGVPALRDCSLRGVPALQIFAVETLCERLGEAGETINTDQCVVASRPGVIWPSFDLHLCRCGRPMLEDSESGGRVRPMPRAPTWKNQTIGRLTPTWMAICRVRPPSADGGITGIRSIGLRGRLRSETIASSRSRSAGRRMTHTA